MYSIVAETTETITINIPKHIWKQHHSVFGQNDQYDQIDLDFRELEVYEVSPQIEYLASKALSSDFVWFTKVL